MDRRTFVKLAALGSAPVLIKGLEWALQPAEVDAYDFSIRVNSNAAAGHLIRNRGELVEEKGEQTETLIVGGGIAGLTAAYQLKQHDFLLCELDEDFGGTSSYQTHKDQVFSQGAHYDLAYPETYGREVLELLYETGVIRYNSIANLWEFVEKQYLINPARENRSIQHSLENEGLVESHEEFPMFYALLKPYEGHMHLPTRLISDEFYHILGQQTFAQFLRASGKTFSPDFLKQVSYQMRDDYGGGIEEVSALAGVHYYTCRPYFEQDVELFSPPQGNHYFAQNLIKHVPQEQLLGGHLVAQISETKKGFEVEVIDVRKRTIKTISCKRVVYAGKKHGVRYCYPQDTQLFAEHQTTPWSVTNVVLNNALTKEPAFWQNEQVDEQSHSMGFVDSASQYKGGEERRTFSVYHCYPSQKRRWLQELQAEKLREHVMGSVRLVEQFLSAPLSNAIEQVYFKKIGHGITIPRPGYHHKDLNALRSNAHLVYAGVDTGRLPLLFEAMDSGIEAVKHLQKKVYI